MENKKIGNFEDALDYSVKWAEIYQSKDVKELVSEFKKIGTAELAFNNIKEKEASLINKLVPNKEQRQEAITKYALDKLIEKSNY